MKAGKHYKVAREKIRKGQVYDLDQLKNYLSFEHLSSDMGISQPRLEKLFDSNSGKLKVGEVIKLSTLLKVDFELMASICVNQFLKGKGKRKIH